MASLCYEPLLIHIKVTACPKGTNQKQSDTFWNGVFALSVYGNYCLAVSEHKRGDSFLIVSRIFFFKPVTQRGETMWLCYSCADPVSFV